MLTGCPRRLFLVAALLWLGGCAGGLSDVTLDLRDASWSAVGAPAGSRIEVTDIRRSATMERTTIGDTSMGRILLQPGEAELVRGLLADRLAAFAQAGGRLPERVLCGIRVFDITTPATALYWDVTAEVALVLRSGGRDHPVAARAVERTWVWPSEALLQQVAAAALADLGAEIDRVLPALAAGAAAR